MEERKVIVIPDAMQHEMLRCWSGICVGWLEVTVSDPGPAQQCFTLQRIRDDEESS